MQEDGHILKRLFSLGREKCGFKLVNVTSDDPREFTIIATDTNNTIYRASFAVTILSSNKRKKLFFYFTKNDFISTRCKVQISGSHFGGNGVHKLWFAAA